MKLKKSNFLQRNLVNFNSKLAIKYPSREEVANWLAQAFANPAVRKSNKIRLLHRQIEEMKI